MTKNDADFTFFCIMLICVLFAIGAIGYRLTHHCAHYHTETVQRCDTFGVNSNNPWTKCTTSEQLVCDEWRADAP